MQGPIIIIKEFDYKVIERNGKCGIMDLDGNIIVDPIFDHICIVDGGDCDYVSFRLNGYGEAVYPLSRIKELRLYNR